MNSNQYKKIMRLFQAHPKYIFFINIVNRILTLFAFIMYPVLIFWMVLSRDERILSFIIVPAFSFLFVSIFRKMIHKPRPYEVHDIKPLIPREKSGDSFPSRHVFSIFLIAAIWFAVCPYVSVFLFLCGICLGFLRVIGGVHFPQDVVFGAILGVLCGSLTIMIAGL